MGWVGGVRVPAPFLFSFLLSLHHCPIPFVVVVTADILRHMVLKAVLLHTDHCCHAGDLHVRARNQAKTLAHVWARAHNATITGTHLGSLVGNTSTSVPAHKYVHLAPQLRRGCHFRRVGVRECAACVCCRCAACAWSGRGQGRGVKEGGEGNPRRRSESRGQESCCRGWRG